MRKISLILLLVLVLSFFSGCKQDTTVTETITYDDGSYLLIRLQANGRTYTSTEGITETYQQGLSAPGHFPSQNIFLSHTTSTTYQFDCMYDTVPAGVDSAEKSGSTGLQFPESAYFWLDTRIIRVFTPTNYITWETTEDGTRMPVWHDIHGNPIYHTSIATKHCSYYSADGRLLWTMSVTGMFKQNAVDEFCQIISSNITVWDTDSWYVIAETTKTEEMSVSYSVQFGRKNLGITIAEPSYTMTLARDKNGIFS